MKNVPIIASLLLLGGMTVAKADITYTFENVPSTYWSDNGGSGQDILGNIPGIFFSPGVQAVHTSTGFPAHSGVLEITQTSARTADFGFRIGVPGISELSFWYTTAAGFVARAYDANNVLLDTFTANPNTTTLDGTDNLAVLLGNNIERVSIEDKISVSGLTTVDDIQIGTPEITSTLGLLGLAGVGIAGFRRKFVSNS
jgi:hypothetical protein